MSAPAGLRPQLSLGLPNFGDWVPPGEWRRLLDVARMADDAGVDRLVVVDHVVMGPHTERYRWGRFPTGSTAPWVEPLSLLSALGAVTDRVRLGTGILIASLRGAATLAKTAATIDVLTNGRLDLGVGLGWQREEYDACGYDWERRGDLLTDTLGACAALWRGDPAAYDGPTVSFDETWCEPKPVQPGGVPFWVAGSLAPRNLERLVRFGTGWIPIMGADLDSVRDGVAVLHEAFAAAGRDPATLQVQAPAPMVRTGDRMDLAATLAGVPDLVAAGVTSVNVPLKAFSPTIDGVETVIAEAVERFAGVVGR